MKQFSKYFLIKCLLFFSLGVSAHSPDISSTLLVEESEGKWILQIRAALTAFEYEIENHFGKSSYATPEEFQELVVRHVKEHISIKTNHTNVVALNNGIVKLGHETSISFEVVGIPSTFKNINVTNSSFQTITRNQSALIVLKKGFSKNQFKLDNSNGHNADLKVSALKFTLITPPVEASIFPLSLSLSLLMGGTLIGTCLFIMNRRISCSRSNYSLQERRV